MTAERTTAGAALLDLGLLNIMIVAGCPSTVACCDGGRQHRFVPSVDDIRRTYYRDSTIEGTSCTYSSVSLYRIAEALTLMVGSRRVFKLTVLTVVSFKVSIYLRATLTQLSPYASQISSSDSGNNPEKIGRVTHNFAG